MPIGATTTKGRMPLERRGREARTTQIPAVSCVHVVRPRLAQSSGMTLRFVLREHRIFDGKFLCHACT